MMRNQALIIKIGNGWKWSMVLVPVVVDNLDNFYAEKYLLPAVSSFWVNLITTEPCSPEPWNHGLYMGNHPLLWPNYSG